MDMNVLKGRWKEIKGEIQKRWGQITGDELEIAKGDATSLAGLIQRKYGTAKDEAESSINELIAQYTNRPESEVVMGDETHEINTNEKATDIH